MNFFSDKHNLTLVEDIPETLTTKKNKELSLIKILELLQLIKLVMK